MKTNKICCVAELKEDIDDMIMIDYLFRCSNDCQYLVLDPMPKKDDMLAQKRLKEIESWGIRIEEEILPETKIIFNGGRFTKIANYLKKGHTLDYLFANGGFAGINIVDEEDILEKFKNKRFVRTFNLNMDVISGSYVVNSDNIKKMVFVSKNVCHSGENTITGIWKNYSFLKKYNLKPHKRLHDLLMAKEGTSILHREKMLLNYLPVDFVTEHGLQGVQTKWGSRYNDSSNIYISTNFLKPNKETIEEIDKIEKKDVDDFMFAIAS